MVSGNVIYCGDNLEILPKYLPDESVDLIYIDPPFNSSRNYEVFWGEAQERRAFEDRFGNAMTYIEWMRPRIRELHRVLKPTGSLYYHCDPHAGHYVKVELDRVFGFDSFQREIVWRIGWLSGFKTQAKNWIRNHDTILFYTKSRAFTFNKPIIPYRQGYRRRDGSLPKGKGIPVEDTWNCHPEDVGPSGEPLDSIMVKSFSKEKLGYPTQKPLALLERIVSASSNPADVVLDAFCGCGTTLEAAAKWKRQWIGIDFSPTACRVMANRLETRLGLKEGKDFELRDMPRTAEQLRRMPPFEFQNWAVVALGGIPNKVKVGDYGIDGRLYLADMAKEKQEGVQPGKQTIFEALDRWYPIQVKQVDRAGRPDIDSFETAMRRDKRLKGFFIAFGFSSDATKEIQRANREDGLDIVPVTVDEILEHERVATAI